MKFAYKFSNLLGTIYRKGNIVFTPDGNSVISPVGNKITIYNLKNNQARTLALESRFNYTAIDISPNGCLMVAVNERGEAQMISMVSQTVIHTYKFSSAAHAVRFSPNGEYFAVSKENMVFIFKAPGEATGEYNSFVLRRYFFGAHDDISTLDWSSDSKILIVGSKDNSTKIYGIELYDNFRPYLLAGHTDSIVGCHFEDNSLDANTVSKNGELCLWQCSVNLPDLIPTTIKKGENADDVKPKKKKAKENDELEDDEYELDTEKVFEKTSEELEKEIANAEFIEGANEVAEDRDSLGQVIAEKKRHPFYYTRLARHYLMNEIKKEDRTAVLTAASYHKKIKLLITAYSTGAFYLHEMPDVSLIHSLSISNCSIETATFNDTGDWVAFGAPELGQLLVWEWQSEQYVMKQQGHSSEMSCMSYSADGQYIVTGGEDAKVKLWNVSNGFCFVTFSEHTGAVTAVQFSANKKYFISASLDGTVRAYDITRYRNFRTFTSPRPVQFCSAAIDHSGEFIAAGGQDVFEIYLWSMKFGRLLEILSAHEGPVVSMAFSPSITSTVLVSGAWDKTIRIWNCLESSSDHETIDVLSDVTCVAFKPNGEEIAVSTLNGNVQVFDVKTSQQVSSIEGKNDLGSGVLETDLITAKKNLQAKCFTTITYSADGESLLAAGKSKNVCIYHVRDGILLKKFEITQNYSLDGLNDFISRRNITEFGNLALVEERSELEGGNIHLRLPGVQKGDMASRNIKPEIRVYAVRFSPTAQSWAATTTEGLLLFSLDKGIVFDPFNLSMEVTPKATREKIQNEEYSAALIMAVKLNEKNLINEIIEQIPYNEIELVVHDLPIDYVQPVLSFVATQIGLSQHVEFYLKWSCTILNIHGTQDAVLTNHSLLALHQNLSRKYDLLSNVCDFNKYTLRVLGEMSEAADKKNSQMENDDDDEENDDSEMEYVDDDDDGDDLMLMSTNGHHED